MKRRLLLYARVAALILSVVIPVAAGGPSEYEVKAAFLYKFGNFVDLRLANNAPITISILGDDPFGESLDSTVRGKSVNGRAVRTRRIRSASEVTEPGIVFISSSETARLPQLLTELHKRNVLTVGESDGFAAAGGIIGLIVENDRVRIEINPVAAQQAGIRIDAKLLSLARIVPGAGKQ